MRHSDSMDGAERQRGGGNAVVAAVGGGQTLVELDSGERFCFPEMEGARVGDRVTILHGRRPSQPHETPDSA
jgi:hypothetical protein